MKYQAIIFDCDGVLVNSERVTSQVLMEMVAEFGVVLSLDTALAHFKLGKKMADTISAIGTELGLTFPADFERQLRVRMAQAFEERLRPVPGVEALLTRLNIPFCVASNGPREKMQLTLGLTKLLPHFQNRIFSAYEIGSWKPEPGLFLHAAHALGVEPPACAVVEDSVTGALAGVAAGMDVYGFVDLTNAAELEAAGARAFHSMAELPGLLSDMNLTGAN